MTPVTSPPLQFAGIFRRKKKKKDAPKAPGQPLENRFYDRMTRTAETLEKKVKPALYETLGKLHIPAYERKRDVQEQKRINGEKLQQLETMLQEKGWPKDGGLNSIFWQAYHFPARLLGKAGIADAEASPELEAVLESYLPLVKSLDSPRDWQTVQWVTTSTSGNPVELFQQLQAIKTNSPTHWQTLNRMVRWYHGMLKETFFDSRTVAADTLATPGTEARRQAYHNEKNLWVAHVLLPYLSASVTALPDSPEPVKDYAASVLPEALQKQRDHQRPLPVIMNTEGKPTGQPAAFLAMRKSLGEVLWHLLVLDSDLRGIPLESTLGERVQSMTEALSALAPSQTTSITAPDLILTHDELDNLIPDEVISTKPHFN